MNKKEVIEFIKKRIKFHKRNFNRYTKEVNAIADFNMSKEDISQLKYSNEHMYRSMDVYDELELILKKIEDVK